VTEAQVQTLAMTVTPAQAQAVFVRIVKSAKVDVNDVSVLSVIFWVRMLKQVMGSWVEH
jgi:hypothetical protein